MKDIFYISLLLLLCLSSCMDDKAVLALLDRSEAVMEEHPDSAYGWLCQADSTIAQQSKKTRMRHLLLQAEAMNKLYQQMPPDSLFQEVVDYYDHHGTSNQQLKAHYLLGCIYRDMKEAPQAIQCYYDAVEKADTLSEDCDYTTLYRVYGQMAELFDEQIMPKEELEALKEVQKYTQKAGDLKTYVKGKELMCRPLFMLRDTSAILDIVEETRFLSRKYGLPQESLESSLQAIFIYLGRNQFDKAHELIRLYEKGAVVFNKDYPDSSKREAFNIIKGAYYAGTNQFGVADSIYRALLRAGFEFEAYDGLLNLFQKQRESDSIVKYWPLYDESFAKRYTTLYSQSMHKVSALYDYTRHQRLAKKRKDEADRNWILFIASVSFATIILIMVYGMHKRFRMNKLRDVARLNSNLAKVKQNYMKALTEWQTKEQVFSIKMSEKQGELERLSLQLQEYQRLYDVVSPSDKESALMHSDIVLTFRDMVKPARNPIYPSQSDWEYLQANVERCLPSFYSELAKASLSRQEFQVTLLTRLNFSPADMAILLNTKVQRIVNAKGSANRKLFNMDDAKSFPRNLKRL